ncbi:flagellar biosynthesis anti-sigma factor FlgM [Paenalkalicoccus suaedae]|uniref:Negative regulator of flagellin synthesis n=1 Tax=Paenalkalicoccus suaedae TaxID=2592382 RepID=A0A859FHS2_9BACI|nr:flagellar biosynthesis anti-sigma factor FlgM [Paenalkalicoccus suaedae]QKS72360.1 flagellar biosynthesis anti-sigma factor FlgM [Paenalkalicoccus suaedae]
MKINPMHSVQAYRKLQEAQERTDGVKSQKADKLEISSEAKEMAKSQEVLAARSKRVEELKDQVQNGTYKVNHQTVANKLYDFWNN